MSASTWRRFLAGPRTLGPTPGAREAWHRGRPRYAVWLLRVETPAVRARLDEAAELLAPHGLRPVGEPHVTLFVAGFPTTEPVADDDVAEATLHAQRAALTGARAPTLVVGGLNAFLSCAFLEVRAPLGGLLRPLRAQAREVRFAPLVPHVTVGTFTDSRPTGPIAAAITPRRVWPPIVVRPESVELVELDPEGRDERLHTRWRVTLSGYRAPSAS